MVRNSSDGYLTEGCEHCPFWSIGNVTGCCVPAPIMTCPCFAKLCTEEQEKMNK